jgi:ketosteroid isomerase-like protein
VSDTNKQVLMALETYESAVLARDLDAFMCLYDPEVRIFDAWAEWMYEGAATWRVSIENWFSSLRNESVSVRFDDVKIMGDGGFGSMTAFATYSNVSDDGQVLGSIQNRISWILQVSGGELRVIHEHTSVPVVFEDAKAIFHRESP